MILPHPLHLKKFKYSELSELYIAETIKNLAFSLVGVFIPIYLLGLGYSFTSICQMFLALNVTRFAIEPLVGYLVSRFGPKHILAFSYPFSFFYLLLISLVDTYRFPLLLIAAVWAVSDSLHWVSYHSDFSKVKKTKKTSREIGFITMLGVIASALGPLIGGYVGNKYGLHILFIVSPILLLCAAIPLLKTKEKVKKTDLNYAGVFKRVKTDCFAHFSQGFDVTVGTTVWPLFMILLYNNFLQAGAVVSAAFMLSIIMIYISGHLSDRVSRKFLVFLGSISLSAVNILRYLTTSIKTVFQVNLLGTLAGPLTSIPLFSLFYNHAGEKKRIEYNVLIEMSGDLGRSAIWGTLLLLSTLMPMNQALSKSFLITAIAVLGVNLVKTKIKKTR